MYVGALQQFFTCRFGVVEEHVHWLVRQLLYTTWHIQNRLRPVRQEQDTCPSAAIHEYRGYIIPLVISKVRYFRAFDREQVQVSLALFNCREYQLIIVVGKGHAQHAFKAVLRDLVVLYAAFKAVIDAQVVLCTDLVQYSQLIAGIRPCHHGVCGVHLFGQVLPATFQ